MCIRDRYENFEEIDGHYEILGMIRAVILPINCSTNAKRTEALIKKTGEIGANGVVGIYDEVDDTDFLSHARTTGIAVLVTDKDDETKDERAPFIAKILPIIWGSNIKKDKKLERSEDLMLTHIQCDMRKKGYYAKRAHLSQNYTVSDLNGMDKEQLTSLFGKETDYVLVFEVSSKEKIFLGLGESGTIHIKATLFSLRDQAVTWSLERDIRSWTGIVRIALGDEISSSAGSVLLVKMPLSGLELKRIVSKSSR